MLLSLIKQPKTKTKTKNTSKVRPKTYELEWNLKSFGSIFVFYNTQSKSKNTVSGVSGLIYTKTSTYYATMYP